MPPPRIATRCPVGHRYLIPSEGTGVRCEDTLHAELVAASRLPRASSARGALRVVAPAQRACAQS